MLRKLLIIMIMINTAACSDSDTVKIGIITSMSGKFADHGVLGRNGIILAVDEINRNGGINGRKIVTVIKDDKSIPEEAFRAAGELHSEGIKFIIGPFITGSATAMLPLINEKHILTIGPTIAGDNLSYMDDYFIKLFPSTKDTAVALGRYASGKKRVMKCAAICDLTNKPFSDSWYGNFAEMIRSSGGQMSAAVNFSSDKKPDYGRIAREALKSGPDAILIVAGSLDLAYICQKIRKKDRNVLLFTASWGVTSDLITNGGDSVNGLLYYLPFDLNDTSETYTGFKKRFNERFGVNPGFSTGLYYEAMKLLDEGMIKSGSFEPDKVKLKLIETGSFKGIQRDYSIDRYGDVHRPFFLYTIREGNMTRLNE